MKKLFSLYTLMYIMTYLAAVALCTTIISVANYLVEYKIVELRYEWLRHPYSIGIGVLCYFPTIFLFRQLKK